MFELVITDADGGSRVEKLSEQHVTVGRSLENTIAFPDDLALSRRHCALERTPTGWSIEDLGSRNGTYVNGEPLVERRALRSSDSIAAGGVTLQFRATVPPVPDRTVVFIPDAPADRERLARSVRTRLDALPAPELESALQSRSATGISRVEALLEAGRALAGHLPLAEIFPLILDLSARAVGAHRGVVMTTGDNGELEPRATRGADFRIPHMVRQRVIEGRESLLVRDARSDSGFKGSMTVVEMGVRSFLAVPLQTDKQVLGLVYLDSPGFIQDFAAEDLTLLTVMANIAAIRIEHARLLEVEHAEKLMQKEMQQAAEIQGNLLPSDAPALDTYQFAGSSTPCRAVGGDYFDYVPLLENRTGVLIADVAGKGLAAALLMTSLQARVQLLAEVEKDLGLLVTRLNRSVASTCPGNRFITFFLAAVDPRSERLSFVNAGHNSPFILRRDGKLEMLSDGGPVLGILKQMRYAAFETTLAPGEILLLYSDGVTEAVDPAGEEYGEDRLEAALRSAPAGTSAQEILFKIIRSVAAFTGSAPSVDDLTLVVVRRT